MTISSLEARGVSFKLSTNLGTTFKATKNLGARAPGLFSSSLQLSLTLVPDPQASQGVRSFELSVTSIHKRPIFWSLATNLGTTFKAPTNLGALEIFKIQGHLRSLKVIKGLLSDLVTCLVTCLVT